MYAVALFAAGLVTGVWFTLGNFLPDADRQKLADVDPLQLLFWLPESAYITLILMLLGVAAVSWWRTRVSVRNEPPPENP